MKTKISYINKHWECLRMLLKPGGECFLVISKMLLIILLTTFLMVASAQTLRKNSGADGPIDQVLRGTVVSAVDNKPLDGVSIRIDQENLQITTSKDGTFELTVKNRKGKIKFSYVGFKTQMLSYTSGVSLTMKLIPEDNKLEEVEVVSTGYQKIPKERATGSFEFVDNKLFNRKVSTDFISRLEDVVPSISSTKVFYQNQGKGSLMNINIRGISTMRSDRWPLMVIDGVPYAGQVAEFALGTFNNINPNDIENITVLKDAAASSIWGAQSGNGVIVITTKRGKYNQPFKLYFNSNITVGQKPNLYYYPQMSSSDYIDMEKYLFDQGHWNGKMDQVDYNLTPVIQLLKKQKNGLLTAQEVSTELDRLKGIDMRDDFLKYIYRKSINQQYSVRLTGGGEKINTAFSVGYDKNKYTLVTSNYDRLTLKNNTQVRPLKKLTVDLGITYTESKKVDSDNPMGYNMMGAGESNFPYMQLADKDGRPLQVDAVSYNPIFRDTAGNGRLLDWNYRPLEELYETKSTQELKEIFVNLSARYELAKGLNMNGLYSYQRSILPVTTWKGIGAQVQRNYINYFADWRGADVIWNIPVGDFLTASHWDNFIHQGRITADFNRVWNDKHELIALAGAEIRRNSNKMTASVYQGYNPETGSFQSVQYGREVPALNGKYGIARLVDYNQFSRYDNRFVSYFANGAYTYNKRYTLSASFRKDASNLFGVKSNDRGQPFWSIGGAWLLSQESFMDNTSFSMLKFRTTYGYNGNVNNSTSAYPIMMTESVPHYMTNQNYGMMMAPPNPTLRWERVGILNLGMDFGLKSGRLSGAVEYYRKRPIDLIARTQIDPTTGYNALMINSADLDTRGWDISLNASAVKSGSFEWSNNLVFAYSRTKVTKSYLEDDLGINFISGANSMTMTPIVGMDLYTQLTYKWAGLDSQTGEPRGYVNGEVSKDYLAISSSKVDELKNHGSLMPLYFGSFRNNFRYKTMEISFNMSYQLGHVFLRNSFNNHYFISSRVGLADFAQRWQKPGDEKITEVPAFTYPNNFYASELYRSSSALVEPAGQIKLRDIQLSYTFPDWKKMKLKNLRLYAYIQNVGTIWRANKWNIDPEYGRAIPEPLSTSLGLSFNL